jgi:DNA-binding MarR family transcriptional regulator
MSEPQPFDEPTSRANAAYILRLRKAANQHFRELSDASWSLILAIYTFNSAKGPSKLVAGERAQLSPTTAIRWLQVLQRQGILDLVPDRDDKRMVRVQLTAAGRGAISRTFVAARYMSK